jgi:hypothetical protein
VHVPRRLRSSLAKGHPRAQPVPVVLVRCRSPPSHTLTARIDRPPVSPSYVVNIYFNCFRCPRSILQVFHMDVAYVTIVIHVRCKRLF